MYLVTLREFEGPKYKTAEIQSVHLKRNRLQCLIPLTIICEQNLRLQGILVDTIRSSRLLVGQVESSHYRNKLVELLFLLSTEQLGVHLTKSNKHSKRQPTSAFFVERKLFAILLPTKCF